MKHCRSIGIRRLVRFLKDSESVGYRIPPSALLHLGGLKPVLAALRSGIWPAPSPLVLIRDGRSDLEVFFVSCGDGMILNLCDVAAALEFPGRIWGLQLPGLDGEAEPLTSIPEMAQYYVDAVLRCRTPASFHLLGYSFGGLIAVEMARILLAQRRNVGLVALLDTGCFEKYWPRPQWFRFAANKARRRVLEMAAMPPRQAMGYLVGKGAAAFRLVRRRIGAWAQGAAPTKSIYYVGGLEPNFQRVRDASIAAFERHNPKPIACDLVLFKSASGESRACDPVGIWSRLTSNLEVVTVPGTHTGMIRKPLARNLAGEISRRLALFR